MTPLEKLHKLISELPSVKGEKRARHYADEILSLKTREERKAALEQVPEEHRQTVKFYVYDHFAKRSKTRLPDHKEKA